MVKGKKNMNVYNKPTCQPMVMSQTAVGAEPFAGEVSLHFTSSVENGFDGFTGRAPYRRRQDGGGPYGRDKRGRSRNGCGLAGG